MKQKQILKYDSGSCGHANIAEVELRHKCEFKSGNCRTKDAATSEKSYDFGRHETGRQVLSGTRWRHH